jgi:hypothetical protein
LKSPRNDTGMDMTNLHRSPPMNQSETDLGIVNESKLLRFGIRLKIRSQMLDLFRAVNKLNAPGR